MQKNCSESDSEERNSEEQNSGEIEGKPEEQSSVQRTGQDTKQKPGVKYNREEILKGPIARTIFKLSWPIIVGNTMQVVYNLADTFWVGKLGANEVAAISVGFPLVFLLISIGAGFTIAGTALVAQYTGAGDEEGKNRVGGQLLIFIMALAVSFSIIGVVFNKRILMMMGTPAELLADASGYLTVIFSGVSFMFLFFIFSSLLRGYGDTRTPMKMMVASTILNIILDPFLIFGWWIFPGLGVVGAAVATVFSRAAAGIVGIYMLFKGNKGLRLRLKYLQPDFKLVRKIISIGLPSAAEQSIVALGMTVLMGIVTNFGALAVAAFGIGNRILSVINMPARGVSMATTTMVGQNIGAANVSRAEKTTWVSSGIIFVVLSLFSLVISIFPGAIIMIFNSNPEVLRIGSGFIRIVGLSFGFLGVRFVIGGSFRGAGNTMVAMILSIIALWVLRLPLVSYLSLNLDWKINGVWWGIALSNIIAAAIGVIWFKLGNWKKSQV